VATFDEYFAARDRRDSARAQVQELSTRLREVADLLQSPELVQLNEPTQMRISRPIPYTLDESKVPTWPQIADAFRAFFRAEDDYRFIESSLSPAQRRRLTPNR
jgi:hypothetical protein